MPIETIYSELADGAVLNYTTAGEGWGATHGSGAGTSVDVADAYENIRTDLWGSNTAIQRCFFFFDLSAIVPGSAELTRVTLYLCKEDVDPVSGGIVEAQKGTQQDTLSINDFNAFEGSLFGSADYADGVLADNEYGAITFNTEGIAYINSLVGTGAAKICVREYLHDYLDTSPGSNSYAAYVYMSEEITQGKPKLVCEFSFEETTGNDFNVEFSNVDYWYTKLPDMECDIAIQFPYAALITEIAVESEDIDEVCLSVVSPREIVESLEEIHYIKESAPYSIQLREKPSADYPVIIEGYIQVTSIPSAYNQFYLDSLAGICYFYLTQAGDRIVVIYSGMGSFIKAADLNRFSSFLNRLQNPIRGLRVVSMPVPDRRVRLFGGFVSVSSVLSSLNEMFIDFGPKGNFETARMYPNYWRKVLIGTNLEGEIIVEEGLAVPLSCTAVVPILSDIISPCAVVSLYDNEAGLIASITNIEQSQIKDVRSFIGGA